MNKIQTPVVKYDSFKLQGGLDLVTPTLSLPPGVARDALNFEVSVTGGYSRVAGYERFDGRPSPSAASYGVVTLTAVAGVTVGSTIQNQTGTITGRVIALNGLNVVYTKAVGSFTNGLAVYVGAGLIGTVTATTNFTSDAATQASYNVLASDVYRADIQVVPGSGPVRGVAYLNDTLYAWRNNAGGTAMAIYKSSGAGWVAVSLGSQLSFTGGTGAAIVEGNTVTGATSGATGVVARVVVQNGTTWAGATGRLILSSTTGTFSASENLQVSGTTRAVAGGAASAITLAPGGRVQTVTANLSGASGSVRLYGCDNVNNGFEFDGTVYVPIVTGMSVDKPKNVAVHKNHLFFSFDASLQHSGVGTPYVWSPVFGAAELAMPESITALQSMPGDASTGTLAVFGRNNTFMLYGTGVANWNLVSFDRGTGANSYTVNTITDAYALDDRGVVALATSRNFGGFDSSTLTFQVKPFVQARRLIASAAAINREKSQYRVFYSDGYALYLTIVNGKLLGAMPVQMPDAMMCWCEGETVAAAEVSYCGGNSGYVYKMETGRDFDGVGVAFQLKLNFNPQGSARVLKRYRRASLELTGEGYATFAFGYSLGYDSTSIDQASTQSFDVPFAAANWDNFVWDFFTWDSKSLSPGELDCNGTAENIALQVSGNSRLNSVFTINSATLHYSPRRGIR